VHEEEKANDGPAYGEKKDKVIANGMYWIRGYKKKKKKKTREKGNGKKRMGASNEA